MVIKASSAKEVDALLADLSSDHDVRRDAAIARLTVIGSRAVDRLVELAANAQASVSARIAAFRTLEGIGESRAIQPAIAMFGDADVSVAVAALTSTRPFLKTSRGVDALDAVIEVALDRRRPLAARIAAIQLLAELPAETVKPVLTPLRADPEPEIRNASQPARARAAVNTVQRLEDAAGGTLPADADAMKSAVVRSGAEVPVATLQNVIERIRVREGSEARERRTAWMAVRAAAHLALAQRGSRSALYDLRETIESAKDRLPVEFFAAVTDIGDVSCLEPLATAYSQVKDDWSRRHLADAFRAIVRREQVTKRHAAAKKIEKRWPGVWDLLR